MQEITNCKCPSCTGPLHFSSETGDLECEYCGSHFTVDEIETFYQEKEEAAAADKKQAERQKKVHSSQWDLESDSMSIYSCPSCGAQLICDEITAASCCPYCGNPTIIPGQLSGTLKPDYVIPFKLNKQDAQAALRRHCQKKLLLPKIFLDQNHVQEIKGIYVPFWLFSGQVSGHMIFHGTRSRHYRSGDYRVTEISHYDISRAGSLAFQMVPVDGSQKMPDALMDSLEPYDYRELTEFSTAYLPGFYADKYDVDSDEAADRAEARCIRTTSDQIRGSVNGYGSLSIVSQTLDVDTDSINYALLPVWLLTTKWQDKTYFFAMNGQTGKIVGDLPIDRKKKMLLFLGAMAAASLIFSIFLSGSIGNLILHLLGL